MKTFKNFILNEEIKETSKNTWLYRITIDESSYLVESKREETLDSISDVLNQKIDRIQSL